MRHEEMYQKEMAVLFRTCTKSAEERSEIQFSVYILYFLTRATGIQSDFMAKSLEENLL